MTTPNGQSSILSNLGLSRFERAFGVLLIAIVIGGLVLEKLSTSEAAAMLVALTGVAAAISTGRKTTADAAAAYATAAEKSSEQNARCLELKQEMSERIDALEKRLGNRENRVATLEKQNQRLKERLDAKDEVIGEHQRQLAKLTEAVLQKDKRIDELESLSEKQRQEIADLRLEVEQLRAGK